MHVLACGGERRLPQNESPRKAAGWRCGRFLLASGWTGIRAHRDSEIAPAAGEIEDAEKIGNRLLTRAAR